MSSYSLVIDNVVQQSADVNIEGGVDPNNPSATTFATWNSEPPPAPRLKSNGVVATDITEQFINATQQFEVGELIKDPFFTLFEAVGALEIMDPKMDSGYLEPGETMEDDYDFSQPLLPEEIIGIIDQLICHEIAWHKGHPLGQTIFTSLYIDRLLDPCPTNLSETFFDRSESCSDETLNHQVLRAYCLGLVKTCCFVNERIKAEHFYEEEDFVTHTFHRSLLENIHVDDVLQLLLDTLERLSSTTNISGELKAALRCRLEFREAFLKTAEEAETRTSMQNIKDRWLALQILLPDLKSSTSLGKPFPTSFSAKLQRKLASTVPPRPIVELSWDTAYEHLERLCRDGSVAAEVLKYYDSHSLMTFVLLFQARKPQPSVYIRTLLQHYIFGDMVILGSMSVRQVLDDDLASTVLPAHKLLDRNNDEIEHPSDPRFNMANQMEVFRARAAGSYLDILRTICQNRCRIRRTLCRLVADWEVLQLDAEELDVDLRKFASEKPIKDREISSEPIYSFPLSSWAYLYKLRQMEWLVQMGFELEVYQPDELASMYWYVQYLARTRTRHLERIRGFDVRNFNDARRRPDFSDEKQMEFMNALSFVNHSTMEATATYNLADALSCVFTILGRLSLIPIPPRPYSTDLQRYEVRMKPFQLIGLPELIPFEELSKVVAQPEGSSIDILEYASESVTAAKKGFEQISKLSPKDAYCQGSYDSWLKNTKDCLKAAIFTGITIATVRKAIESTPRNGQVKIKAEIPATGKGYHDWWVVPKVVAIP
ncbi:amino-acid N-acetyltransferas-like protein subunit Mak10 [Amylocarpus encephaloides]|uniref:Amino-acid N-acetyltransferas-like protein subunit Mak10 n=1 Tax=Amylocarpus encephaloides TaxID=45428 RepID=A0A9P7YDG6_9HELO|nr:amino-acid N-acetyltransferas-like protein subunit Mak10 [Amylocarpus encephaloides]